MQKIQGSIIISSILLLAGCGLNPTTKGYAEKANVYKPLETTADSSLKSDENYYPIPRKPNFDAKSPSLVPPGSNLGRFEKTSLESTKSEGISVAKWSKAETGEPILVLLEQSKQAWSHVGKALRATDYQILDQDPSMSSYYILDTRPTGKQITEKTPIYRVYIKDSGNDSSKVVLLSEANQAASANVSKRILGALEQHLV